MKVFVGGSRKISNLSAEVRLYLDHIIEQKLTVLIGDANGADKAVQDYLQTKDHSLVEVFCAGSECRNNQGDWPIRLIESREKRRNFDFYSTKDKVMAAEASVGFMIWDGKSKGTLMNIYRLLQSKKGVSVYISTDKKFVDLHSIEDWTWFISTIGTNHRASVEHQIGTEQQSASSAVNLVLF